MHDVVTLLKVTKHPVGVAACLRRYGGEHYLMHELEVLGELASAQRAPWALGRFATQRVVRAGKEQAEGCGAVSAMHTGVV
jgi:hypothetical protein